MQTHLHVETPAVATRLASLADLKTALGIADGGSDARLGALLERRSALMANYCRAAADQLGRRSLARETCVITFNATDRRRDEDLILPWRVPVVSVASVEEDGTTLDASAYQVHGGAAILVRLNEDGNPYCWSTRRIVITCDVGWVCYEGSATVPPEVQAACLEECRAAWLARERDPTVRSEDIPDVIARGYALPGAVGGLETQGGLLSTTTQALQPYRNPWPV